MDNNSLDDINISLLQNDLNNFNEWCFICGLSLNVDKVQRIILSKKT